jgi:hypothetical protein
VVEKDTRFIPGLQVRYFFFFIWDRIMLHIPGWHQTHNLPVCLLSWDYRHLPPPLVGWYVCFRTDTVQSQVCFLLIT